MANKWIEFVRDYSTKNNISWSCALCEIKKNNLYTLAKKRPEKITTPKAETKENQYSFSVKTKREMGTDSFNFSRDFKYETIETDDGYDFIFNNERDYLTAIDLTNYVYTYKNPKLYKWIFEPVQEKTKPPPAPKPAPKPARKPARKPTPKPTPKADDEDIQNIIDEWEQPTISYVIAQSKYIELLDKIENLIEKDNFIIVGTLFFNPKLKKLLGELYSRYSIKQIDEVMVNIIGSMGGKVSKGNYESYIKNMPSRQLQQKLYKDIDKK